MKTFSAWMLSTSIILSVAGCDPDIRADMEFNLSAYDVESKQATFSWSVQPSLMPEHTTASISPTPGELQELSGTRSTRASPGETFTLSARLHIGDLAIPAGSRTIHIPSSTEKPRITFATSDSVTRPGEPVTVTWETTNADAITIEPGGANLDPAGTLTLRPVKTTTYKLFARNDHFSSTAQFTIEILDDHEAPQPPRLVGLTIVGGSIAEIEWTSSSDNQTPDNDIRYLIYAIPANSEEGRDHEPISTLQGSKSLRYENLKKSTKYHFYVQAMDEAGNRSDTSNTITETTFSSDVKEASDVSYFTIEHENAKLLERTETGLVITGRFDENKLLTADVITSIGEDPFTFEPESILKSEDKFHIRGRRVLPFKYLRGGGIKIRGLFRDTPNKDTPEKKPEPSTLKQESSIETGPFEMDKPFSHRFSYEMMEGELSISGDNCDKLIATASYHDGTNNSVEESGRWLIETGQGKFIHVTANGSKLELEPAVEDYPLSVYHAFNGSLGDLATQYLKREIPSRLITWVVDRRLTNGSPDITGSTVEEACENLNQTDLMNLDGPWYYDGATQSMPDSGMCWHPHKTDSFQDARVQVFDMCLYERQ